MLLNFLDVERVYTIVKIWWKLYGKKAFIIKDKYRVFLKSQNWKRHFNRERGGGRAVEALKILGKSLNHYKDQYHLFGFKIPLRGWLAPSTMRVYSNLFFIKFQYVGEKLVTRSWIWFKPNGQAHFSKLQFPRIFLFSILFEKPWSQIEIGPWNSDRTS